MSVENVEIKTISYNAAFKGRVNVESWVSTRGMTPVSVGDKVYIFPAENVEYMRVLNA